MSAPNSNNSSGAQQEPPGAASLRSPPLKPARIAPRVRSPGSPGAPGSPASPMTPSQIRASKLAPARVSSLSCCKPQVDINGGMYSIPFSSVFVLKIELKGAQEEQERQQKDQGGGNGKVVQQKQKQKQQQEGGSSDKNSTPNNSSGGRDFAALSVIPVPGTPRERTIVLTPRQHEHSPTNVDVDDAEEAEHLRSVQEAVEDMKRKRCADSSQASSLGSSTGSTGFNDSGSAPGSPMHSTCLLSTSSDGGGAGGPALLIPNRALNASAGSSGSSVNNSSFMSTSAIHSATGGGFNNGSFTDRSVISTSRHSSSSNHKDNLKLLQRRQVRQALRAHAAHYTSAEATLLRNVAHPNIVGFVDQFEDERHNYLVMEYVDGGDLREEVKRRADGVLASVDDGASCYFSISSSLFLWVQAVCAVEYLHRHDMLHRDIKTANLLCSRKWRVLLADFGFGQEYSALGHDIDDCDATLTAKGTPHYMAPELFLREGCSGKSDVWALGVILYELLTLQRPFERGHGHDTVDLVASRIVYEEPPRLEELRGQPVPQEIQDLMDGMLNKDPKKRPSAKGILNTPVISRALDEFLVKFTKAAEQSTEEVDLVLADMLREHVAVVRGDDLSGPASRRSQRAQRRAQVNDRLRSSSSSGKNAAGCGHSQKKRTPKAVSAAGGGTGGALSGSGSGTDDSGNISTHSSGGVVAPDLKLPAAHAMAESNRNLPL